MKKQKKHESPQPRGVASHRDVMHEWRPLIEAIRDVVDWAFDLAERHAGDCDEDIEAIDNVREFVHAWLEGRPAEIRLTHLLTALGTLFAAIELDLGIDSVSLLAPIKTFLETPATLPAVLRLPGAAHDERPTKVIRRFPGHRNASAGFGAFAA